MAQAASTLPVNSDFNQLSEYPDHRCARRPCSAYTRKRCHVLPRDAGMVAVRPPARMKRHRGYVSASSRNFNDGLSMAARSALSATECSTPCACVRASRGSVALRRRARLGWRRRHVPGARRPRLHAANGVAVTAARRYRNIRWGR